MQPAVFLDRDGTIIEQVDYLIIVLRAMEPREGRALVSVAPEYGDHISSAW